MRILQLAKCEWCGACDVMHPWSALHCKPTCEKESQAAEAKLLHMMAAMLWPAGDWIKEAMSSALWGDIASRFRGHVAHAKAKRTAIYTCSNATSGEITCSR